MSGRGGGRGGRGGSRFGGRGGGAMGNGLGPTISFQDLQDVNALDKTPMKLYPDMHNMPSLGRISERELRYAQYQLDFMREQRQSPYWTVQKEKKTQGLVRYSDKYRPTEQEQPSLKTVKMNKDFFPADIWDSYMEGVVRKERATARLNNQARAGGAAGPSASRLAALDRLTNANGGDLDDEDEDARRARLEADAQDAAEEQQALGDYEDQEDDDYVFSYFDNGEGMDEDGLGDGGGGDDGGADYD